MFIAAMLPFLATPPAYAKTTIVSASIFKNNYALVTRRIDLPVSGPVLLDTLPRSAQATLWFESTGGLQMKSITATDVPVESTSPIEDTEALLAANVGKRVKLFFIGDKPPATGKVISVSSKLTLLDEGGTTGAYGTGNILSLKVLDPARTTTAELFKKRVLRIVIAGNRAGGLFFTDLEPGLNWAPAYSLDITDRGKLKFISKATIIDDLAPLRGIEAKLVTGFPGTIGLGELDPLIVVRVGAVGTGLTPAVQGQGYVPTGIQHISYDPRDNTLIAEPGVGAKNPTGTTEGDLFFYRQVGVSLAPGERGYFVLDQGDLDYTETYTWTGHNPMRFDPLRFQGVIGADIDTSDVDHDITFKNTGKQPFTSGSASIYRDGQLIGQNILNYTPKGSVAEITVNSAFDVHVEARDEELARDRIAKRIDPKMTADLVTVKTTIVVQNFKDEAITLTARRPFTGDVTDAGGGKTTYDRSSAFALNRSGSIEWQVTVPPGASRTLSFTLKAYVITGSGT